MNKDNILEPEEKNNEEPKSTGGFTDFTPFTEEPIREKSYAGGAIPRGADLNQAAPEPSYTPPPPPQPGAAGASTNTSQGSTRASAPPPPSQPFNPAMNDLPPKEKQAAGEAAADAIISGYKMLNQLAGKLVQFNMRKLEEEHAQGKIDLSIQLNIGGEIITAREYMNAFNAEQSQVFEVTEEFIEEVRPVLIRVLKKRGIGMTDEQLLVYFLIKDAGIKAFMGFQMVRTNNGVISQLREATAANVRTTYTPPPPPTAPAEEPPASTINDNDTPPPPPPATSAAAMVDSMINPDNIPPAPPTGHRASRRIQGIKSPADGNNGKAKRPGRQPGASKSR